MMREAGTHAGCGGNHPGCGRDLPTHATAPRHHHRRRDLVADVDTIFSCGHLDDDDDDDFGVKRWQRPWRRDTSDAVVRGGGVRASDGSETARGTGRGLCYVNWTGWSWWSILTPGCPLMEEDGDGDGDECVRRDDEYFGRLVGGKSIKHHVTVYINNVEACLRTLERPEAGVPGRVGFVVGDPSQSSTFKIS
jgi:hypothetical protein